MTTEIVPKFATNEHETNTMSRKTLGELVRLKRAYEQPAATDGTRILVDRLWPRGVTKESAAIDQWAKDLAPSTELRKWFGHDPARWPEFRRRYIAELRQHAQQIHELRGLARRHTITLVYSAHDELHNDAIVLRDIIVGQPGVS
jgi:uncharacterized protein YeaO (DUF488 family)